MREEDRIRDQWLREMDSSPKDDAELVAEWSREAQQQKLDQAAALAEVRAPVVRSSETEHAQSA